VTVLSAPSDPHKPAGRIGRARGERSRMHDLPLSPEDRGTLLQVVRSQPPRDRLLAELVFGHGLDPAEALSVRAEEIAWGDERVKLAAHGARGVRRTVTAERETVEGILGSRRHGPLFATASGVPIRADYALRLLARVAEAAGVPSGLSVKRVRSRRLAGAR
jgi:integrase